MKEVTTAQLTHLHQFPEQIRNLCVLAHVDHGKTSMSDQLIASNGLIHPRLAGELRFLDSKEEEQIRGITMKSSSISLLHKHTAPNDTHTDYLINLIDSPGHVDFCSEVSTAVRLSDGAFVLVDAVEGVAIQTHAVLRQAWQERLQMVLVINKVDRLVTELRLTPLEAYTRLKAIVAHVNLIMSSLESEQFLSEADAVLAIQGPDTAAGDSAAESCDVSNGADTKEEEEDKQFVFSPELGNVAFASAIDGWAFRTCQFAAMYATKLGAKAEALNRALWGDYAFQAKTKRLMRIKAADQGRLKPLFVQLVLEPIWKAYAVADPHNPDSGGPEVLRKMVANLNLDAGQGAGSLQKALAAGDMRSAVKAVMRTWLPLDVAVLGMAVEHLPSPKGAATERTKQLLGTADVAAVLPAGSLEAVTTGVAAQVSAMEGCDSSADAPLVVFVSKMVAVPPAAIPRRAGQAVGHRGGSEVFLGFGRVFSGTLRDGATVKVLSGAYRPDANQDNSQQHIQDATIRGLYLMMGRGLEPLQEVPAGTVVAIGGLDHAILKSATLTDGPWRVPLAPLLFQAEAIVRVAVEPSDPAQLAQLEAGLKVLNRADPFVEVTITDSGEHVVAAAGEIHLETCIKDLEQRFARVKLQVSKPLVAFRESVYYAPEAQEIAAEPATKRGPSRVVECVTANGLCSVRVRCWPLPASVASALEGAADHLKARLQKGFTAQCAPEAPQGAPLCLSDPQATENLANEVPQQLKTLQERLNTIAADSLSDCSYLRPCLERIWALGPGGVGSNLLLAAEAPAALPHGGSSQQLSGLPSLPEAQPGSCSLFSVPANQVVKASRLGGALGGYQGQAAAGTSAAKMGSDVAVQPPDGSDNAAAGSWVPLPSLGNRRVSALLGFTSETSEPMSQENSKPGAAEGSQVRQLPKQVLQRLQDAVEAGITGGFRIASAAGPLCDEPLWGTAFELEAQIRVDKVAEDAADCAAYLEEEVYGPFVGQVTSAVRQGIRVSVLEAGARLVEAMYLAEVAVNGADALSGVYAVLGRRRARVLRDEMREGSDTFVIHAYLPAEASFGLADELRKRCSGAASASLMLSHWERLQVDPFFVPTTEEELEEWGDGTAVPTNLARKIVDSVRQRKGLPVEQKVVESATKQRTLARKV